MGSLQRKGGLIALATSLGIPGAADVVTGLLSKNSIEQAEAIIREMGRERALNQGELKTAGDEFEKTHPVRPTPTVTRAPEDV